MAYRQSNSGGVDVSHIKLVRKCRNKACGRMMVNPRPGQLTCDDHPTSSETEAVPGTRLNAMIHAVQAQAVVA